MFEPTYVEGIEYIFRNYRTLGGGIYRVKISKITEYRLGKLLNLRFENYRIQILKFTEYILRNISNTDFEIYRKQIKKFIEYRFGFTDSLVFHGLDSLLDEVEPTMQMQFSSAAHLQPSVTNSSEIRGCRPSYPQYFSIPRKKPAHRVETYC